MNNRNWQDAALNAIRFQCDADAKGGATTTSICVVMHLVDTAKPTKEQA